MRLTQYTDFALRTLIYLGASNGRRHTIRDIAEAYDISRHHLTRVAQHLNRHGFVVATRGKGGGLSLSSDASDITIGGVVRAMESPNILVECFDPVNCRCVIEGHCKMTGAFHEAYAAFLSVLDQYTLADLLNDRSDQLREALSISLLEIGD